MIDISEWQHPDGRSIDWPTVAKAGIKAVMIKATEWPDYTNPWPSNDAHYAPSAGLKVGYYHFSHPGMADAQNQAEQVRKAIGDLPNDLGVADDLEVTEGQTWQELAHFAKAFHTYVREWCAFSPLYSNGYFLDNMPGAPWD